MAILCFGGGYFSIVGSEHLYGRYEGLKTLDTGYGIVNIALIPFAFYVRQAFVKCKKDAPRMFYIYYIATAFISLSYLVFLSLILDEGFSWVVSRIIQSLASETLFIALNIIYFNKRKHLFVN